MNKKGWSLTLVTILIVSSTEIILKKMGSSFPVGFQLNFWRFFLGGVFLLAISPRFEKKTPFKRKHLLAMSFHACLFIVFSMSLYQLAINNLAASIVAILFSTNPLITLFIEMLASKKMNFRVILSGILALIAVVMIISPTNTRSFWGILLAFLSALIFSFYTFLTARYTNLQQLPTIKYTGFIFVIGSLELLVVSLISKQVLLFTHLESSNLFPYVAFSLFKGITYQNLPLILYLSLVVTAGGFVLYFICKKEYPNLSPLIFLAKPAVSSIFAVLFLKEVLSLSTFIGILFLLASSLLVTNKK